MNFPKTEKIRGRANVWLIAIFLTMLWAPALDSLFKWNNPARLNEKRSLKPFPTFRNNGGIKQFALELNDYCNDHFGFRKQFIVWGQEIKMNWFHENSMSGVGIGRDGWLFSANKAMIANHGESRAFDVGRLAQWKELLETRRDWLAKKGVDYVFIIAPNKNTIYPEFLPAWLPPPTPPTRLDQFVEYMKTNTSIDVLDLRTSLINAKQLGQVYHRTDTHWNDLGAFIAGEELVRDLAKRHMWLKPLSLGDFEITNEPTDGGNLALLMVATETLLETNNPILIPKILLKPRMRETNTLEGEYIFVEGCACDGRIIGFGDSFGDRLFPYLGYQFKLANFYDIYRRPVNRKYKEGNYNAGHCIDKDKIEAMKPEILIDQILEEYLWSDDPQILMKEDALK